MNSPRRKATEGVLSCGAAQQHRTLAIERGTEGAPLRASNGPRRLDWILSPEPSQHSDGPGVGLVVGVLALQGDFREHRVVLERLGACTREVRQVADLVSLDGLVIPGGESTTISKLMDGYGLAEPVRAFHDAGGVVYGTCAGLITVARDTVEGMPPTLGLMNIVARRNAFGRQVRSFEADLEMAGLRGRPCGPCSSARRGWRRRGPASRCWPPVRATSWRPARGMCLSRRSTRSSPKTHAFTSSLSR